MSAFLYDQIYFSLKKTELLLFGNTLNMKIYILNINIYRKQNWVDYKL